MNLNFDQQTEKKNFETLSLCVVNAAEFAEIWNFI